MAKFGKREPVKQSGFTLIEMIIVMVITGIIGGMVAVFLKAPIQQYLDVARRAELSDIADTALRRLTRDIRTAVPNSVRVANPAGANIYMEYLPTRDGGRYRAAQDCTGACTGNVLTFGAGGSSSFDLIGQAITFAAGDYLVVGSTQSDGNPPYDSSAAGVLRAYSGAAGAQTTVTFAATALPVSAELSSQRFDVVDGAQQAVTYACVGTLGTLDANQNGQGRLMRYWGYGFHAAQQTPAGIAANTFPVTAHSEALLADKLSACNIEYDVINQRYSLVAISLALASGGESVSLYHEVHVNNSP